MARGGPAIRRIAGVRGDVRHVESRGGTWWNDQWWIVFGKDGIGYGDAADRLLNESDANVAGRVHVAAHVRTDEDFVDTYACSFARRWAPAMSEASGRLLEWMERYRDARVLAIIILIGPVPNKRTRGYKYRPRSQQPWSMPRKERPKTKKRKATAPKKRKTIKKPARKTIAKPKKRTVKKTEVKKRVKATRMAKKRTSGTATERRERDRKRGASKGTGPRSTTAGDRGTRRGARASKQSTRASKRARSGRRR